MLVLKFADKVSANISIDFSDKNTTDKCRGSRDKKDNKFRQHGDCVVMLVMC